VLKQKISSTSGFSLTESILRAFLDGFWKMLQRYQFEISVNHIGMSGILRG